MSTGYECEFIEAKAGEWYYLLQNGSCPVAWDFREDCTTVGPFPTYEAAWEYLAATEANPGGHTIYPFKGGEPESSLKRCLDDAVAPMRRDKYNFWRG